MSMKLEQAARQAFETWWEREGQKFLFALNTTTDDDIKLVAEIAWKNGAYCAEQAEQEPGENNDWKKVSYIRETLNAEQAEQEPVACPICGNGYLVKHTEEYCNSCGSVCVSPQTIQENVANKKAAPVRTKDLTDDEISKIWDDSSYGDSGIAFARAVIAADREKNK